MDLHGYAGVVELGDRLVDQLFDGKVFEGARTVRTTAPEDAADFRSFPVGDTRADLLFGAIEVVFPPKSAQASLTNLVTLRVQIARLAKEPADPTMDIALCPVTVAVVLSKLVLRSFVVATFAKSISQLVVDLSAITTDDVALAYRTADAGDWLPEDTLLDAIP